jgi:hypothetical protein
MSRARVFEVRDVGFLRFCSITNQGLFRSYPKTKNFQDSPSHQILRHMHEALNIGKNNN